MVNYWDPKWKELIGKYVQGILDLGVDGILLDQLDTYLYFEDLMPLE
jgi:endo-alpha-1,4-polygalactosaminidase (GH114 family)